MSRVSRFVLILLAAITASISDPSPRRPRPPRNRRPRCSAAGRRRAPKTWYKRPALAGRQQLHSGDRHQPTGDVAGRHVRSGAIDTRTGLGRGHRHEHHARVPARPALEAGRRGLPAAASTVPEHRGQAPHQADVRAVRFLLGSVSEARQAARAEAGRAQFGLGAEPGSEALKDPAAVRASAKPMCKGVVGAFAQRQARAGLGRLERAGQHQRSQLQGNWSRQQGRNSCWRCCPRCSRGRATASRYSR